MNQRHILVVDDEDDIREVATLSLQEIGGWRVSSASCGSGGITAASRSSAPPARSPNRLTR